MVKTKNLTLIVTAAVLAALTCVATMVVQIPMPLTKGYVNFGDVLVLTSAWLLGSPWGIAAAGIGSAMADLLRLCLLCTGNADNKGAYGSSGILHCKELYEQFLYEVACR